MKKRFEASLYFLLGLVGLGGAGKALAVNDVFLCADGVEGASQAEGYQNCIDVLAWSWGAAVPISTAGGTTGREAGKASAQDLSLTKFVDKASPVLMSRLVVGDVIPKVELIVASCELDCKTGTTETIKLTLTDVLVSSQSLGGAAAEVPTESVSLNFTKVEYCYTGTDKSGVPETPICTTWDIAANKVN
ncbi:MAG: type VI secretion system tube protein Hcp [Xanthomonadales bacterium]|jgi:type VI secretion system secreted protein Hcp|nr:type VI secretion system tube protein Hcp [Xanthomonadales bacterium]